MTNTNDVKEFQPIEQEVNSGETSPVYSQSPYPLDYSYASHIPNLYLYTPSNNTFIPCEEIILPSPVMGQDGQTYSGPTNIYLAYPVSGKKKLDYQIKKSKIC